MKISGFTIAKNTAKLHYPVKESILSALPSVDEFVVALGDCDADDSTREEILSIGSPKIKIIDSPWNTKEYKETEMAHQTDIAMSHCTGDWLFYIQNDEAVHEADLSQIRQICQENFENSEVEGILFNYIHFWGDYNHQRVEHGWYRKEIRIVRNRPDIHSWRDAQSFRVIPNFDGKDYLVKEGTRKLNVVESNARIFHYGWVLPPKAHLYKVYTRQMNKEGKPVEPIEFTIEECKAVYGSLKRYAEYKGSHPEAMKARIAAFDWAEQLDYNDEFPKKEKARKKFVTWLEQKVFHRALFEFRNYKIMKKK